MKFQEKTYSCGPASLRAALYVLKHIVKEATIRKAAGTTPEGTSELGLFKALKHYGYDWVEHNDTDAKRNWRRIVRSLKKGMPALLCIGEKEDHWVSAVGLNGDGIIIFDPANPDSKRKRYSGLHFNNFEEFEPLWAHAEDDKPGVPHYYCILIKRPAE